jgi:hypothetical protein
MLDVASVVPEAALERTEHGVVPAGEGRYVLNLLDASRHGAAVAEDTTDGGVAYASVPAREPAAYRDGWLPG